MQQRSAQAQLRAELQRGDACQIRSCQTWPTVLKALADIWWIPRRLIHKTKLKRLSTLPIESFSMFLLYIYHASKQIDEASQFCANRAPESLPLMLQKPAQATVLALVEFPPKNADLSITKTFPPFSSTVCAALRPPKPASTG